MKYKWVRFLCGALVSAVVLTQPCTTVLATEKTAEEIAAEEAYIAEKQAIKDVAPDTNSLTNWPEGPMIQALSGCVMDMDSGAVVYAKNMNEKLYPASITKLMTTLVALENAEMTDTVTFSEDSIAFLEYGDAHIGMRVGEEISMEDALYAVLLASANEVSYAVAESVGINSLGGDYSTFIQEMNERAKELGCLSSSWVNPNGLHDENHYTTAYDMALIASEVYKYEEFRKIMDTYQHTIPETNLVDETRTFQQNHKMLWEGNDYSWEIATGGKTGYTDQAGTTLVTMAATGGMKLACVVLKDYGGDSYIDTQAMMEYVFGNFQKVPLADQELPEEIGSFVKEDAYVLLPEGVDFSSVECEISQNEDGENSTSGKAVFTYEGQIVGKADINLNKTSLNESKEATGDAEKSEDLSEIADDSKEEKSLGQKIFTIAIVATAIIVLLTAFIFWRNYKILQKRKIQRRKKRAAMRRRQRQRRRR